MPNRASTASVLHTPTRRLACSVATMPLADDDGLISGLTEEQLITDEEMDGLVKEVRQGTTEFGGSNHSHHFRVSRTQR